MIIEYVRYKISPDSHNAFFTAYKAAAQSLDDSKYCLGYELGQCEEEPERYILRIRWTSTRDHLQGFRKSTEFRTFLSHIRPFVDDIEEMQHYKLTEVRSQSGILADQE